LYIYIYLYRWKPYTRGRYTRRHPIHQAGTVSPPPVVNSEGLRVQTTRSADRREDTQRRGCRLSRRHPTFS